MNQNHFRRDQLLLWALRTCATISAGVILIVVLFIAYESSPAFTNLGFGRLITDETWSPTTEQYNLLPMVIGTLAATFGSMLLTAPLGIGSAIFLRFYASHRLAWIYRRIIEVLAGVPSVVYGLWGLSVIVPLLADVSPIGQGQSLLAGILILGMMTLPTVIVAADAAIGGVSPDVYRAAAALGLNRRAIAWSVVLPAARNGILTGVILQIGRALGETMAVLMICGNIVQMPGSVFDPVRTLTANIALEMGYADPEHRTVLFASGLILLGIVGAIMLSADWVTRTRSRPPGVR